MSARETPFEAAAATYDAGRRAATIASPKVSARNSRKNASDKLMDVL